MFKVIVPLLVVVMAYFLMPMQVEAQRPTPRPCNPAPCTPTPSATITTTLPVHTIEPVTLPSGGTGTVTFQVTTGELGIIALLSVSVTLQIFTILKDIVSNVAVKTGGADGTH